MQLLIEILIRFYRVLSEKDKQSYYEVFKPYIKQTSGKYIYHLTKQDIPKQLDKLAQIYNQIVKEFEEAYNQTQIYQTLRRVFEEHFLKVEDKIEIIPSKQLPSDIIQSPHDLDATYREKNGEKSKGQTINITEVVDQENQPE